MKKLDSALYMLCAQDPHQEAKTLMVTRSDKRATHELEKIVRETTHEERYWRYFVQRIAIDQPIDPSCRANRFAEWTADEQRH